MGACPPGMPTCELDLRGMVGFLWFMGLFTSTGITNLVRHGRSQTYYLQAKIEGKKVRRSLKTKDQAIARERLPEALRRERARVAREAGMVPMREPGGLREGTWAAVLTEWLEGQRRRPDLQVRTVEYYEEIARYVLEDLDGERAVRSMTVPEAERWWCAVAARRSASVANNVLAVARGALELARRQGVPVEDVFAGCRRVRRPPRELTVPTNEELEAILLSIRSGVRQTAGESADFVEFLAFVGCRIGEAREVTWGDVQGDEILIRGQADRRGNARTKGGGFRRVPIAERVQALLVRRGMGAGLPRGHRVFTMKSPKGALNRATARLGLDHLRIHDLRHFFATHCIEKGVDIPTVAGWLGHKDGGVLAMKTYGHVRNEHSRRMGRLIG